MLSGNFSIRILCKNINLNGRLIKIQTSNTFLSATSVIDKNNDIKTVYKEFNNSKKNFELNILKNINNIDDFQLKEYFDKIINTYDENTYFPIYDRILNNSDFVNFKEKDILKCLNLFKKQIINENNFLNLENIEVSLNSLHLKNDRFTYYLRKMFADFEKDYIEYNNSFDKRILVESYGVGGKNNDQKYNFNFIEPANFKYSTYQGNAK